MKVGILTGGGDCPGLNPAIRGAVMRLLDDNVEVIGFTRGWKGLVEGTTTAVDARCCRADHLGGRHDSSVITHQPVQAR